MNTCRSQRGFTLIELLTVVAIIGIFSSASMSGWQKVYQSGQDATRKADLATIHDALQRFYVKHGVYPAERWCDSSIGSYGQSCADMINNGDAIDHWDDDPSVSHIYRELVQGGYLTELPIDPVNNRDHYYIYEPNNVNHPVAGAPHVDNSGYVLYVRLSNGERWGYCTGPYEDHVICD